MGKTYRNITSEVFKTKTNNLKPIKVKRYKFTQIDNDYFEDDSLSIKKVKLIKKPR